MRRIWKKESKEMLVDALRIQGLRDRLDWCWGNLLYRRPIARITRNWLWIHGIKYDSLTIERGNVDMPYPWGKTHNRFITAGKRKMRIFVEDEINKACRLADICDVVFLVKHPYNSSNERELPNNIIEVDGWKEILAYIRSNL